MVVIPASKEGIVPYPPQCIRKILTFVGMDDKFTNTLCPSCPQKVSLHRNLVKDWSEETRLMLPETVRISRLG